MDSVFPFGFPAATGGYLVLYVLTFALHHFFMHYVLAGSLYVGWCTVASSSAAHSQPLLRDVIREWLPFLLSAAITAGVAPLLFVQIVYPRHFYTANLLLSWKWMIVVPVLIVAFYMLYLQKSVWIVRRGQATRVFVSLITAGCFLFVGFCWTANHALANSEARWPEIYASGQLGLNSLQTITRMAIWAFGSFASLAVFVGWQVNRRQTLADGAVRVLGIWGIAGVVASAVAGVIYLTLLTSEERSGLASTLGGPYLALAAIGGGLQLGGWWQALRRRVLSIRSLSLATGGLICTLIGSSVLREVLRLQAIDITTLYPRHQAAASISGLGVFLAFAVLNASLIGYCIWLVRTRRIAGTIDESGL